MAGECGQGLATWLDYSCHGQVPLHHPLAPCFAFVWARCGHRSLSNSKRVLARWSGSRAPVQLASATVLSDYDMVMKLRAHSGSKKVAAFCTLIGWRTLPVRRCPPSRWVSRVVRGEGGPVGVDFQFHAPNDSRWHEELRKLQRCQVRPHDVHQSTLGCDASTRPPLGFHACGRRGGRSCTTRSPRIASHASHLCGRFAADHKWKEVLPDRDHIGCHEHRVPHAPTVTDPFA